MIFRETEYAEEMIRGGFLTEKYLFELKLLAKYYNKHDNFDEEKTKEQIKEFCKKHLSQYNEVLHLDWVLKSVSYGINKKNIMVDIEKINITQSEIDKIKLLNNYELEKVAFSMLIFSKSNHDKPRFKPLKKDTGYYINNMTEVFKNAQLEKSSSKIKEQYLLELSRNGLIEGVQARKNYNHRLKFVDEKYESNIILTITNFYDFILEYERYIGLPVGVCEECKKNLFKKTSNRKKYCKKCWKEIRNKNQREIMRKKRNVSI